MAPEVVVVVVVVVDIFCFYLTRVRAYWIMILRLDLRRRVRSEAVADDRDALFFISICHPKRLFFFSSFLISTVLSSAALASIGDALDDSCSDVCLVWDAAG